MIFSRLCLFVFLLLIFIIPASAFEDTFQYYPGGDVSSTWTVEYLDANPGWFTATYGIVDNSGATYSRAYNMKLVRDDSTNHNDRLSMFAHASGGSNYWSFNVKHLQKRHGSQTYSNLYLEFFDANGVSIYSFDILPDFANNTAVLWPEGDIGFWEVVKQENDIYIRIDGVDMGQFGSPVSGTPHFIRFRIEIPNGGAVPCGSFIEIDDVSTNGNIVGIGTESTSHTLTEVNLNPINISYTINTYPYADYTNSEYKINIKRSVNGVFTNIQDEIIKSVGNTSVYYGFSNWNRSVDLTGNDLDYGLYMVYLLDDGTNVDTDYFFFAPPGDVSTIAFSNTEIPIGVSETITYSIDGANFGSYNYHIRIYSTSTQIQSTQVTEASSTVSWDTTDESVGLYYAVLSRTDKTSGAYSELVYDIATLTEDVIIRGYAYDAQNETVLANVSMNFSQSSTWFNTTSNASGYYELTGITVNVEVNVNASFTNYTHENFTFTPLSAEIYTMDLYLINDTATYGNTTIGGIVYDYPLHQAIPNATVSIYNATWSDTNTSSTTGFYIFEELTNGSYTVNATKTDYQNSDEYSVDTNNGSWLAQNILMYGIYDLTIRAQDSATDGYITSFSVDYNGVISTTTNGSILYSDLTYGLYTFSISSTGYYSVSEDILVDSTKTETIQLTQTDSIYYTPHYVKFIVWGVSGYYSGVAVSVYEYGDTTTKYTGVTGSDGSVTFKLYETQRYTITFVDASQGINREMDVYPADTEYLIFISSTGSWTTFDEPIHDVIGIEVSTEIINSTHAYVNVSYTDSMSETTAATVYLNQSNSSDPYNQTVIDSQGGLTNNWIHSFIVEDYEGEGYYIHVVATHTTYGTIDQTYAVQFDSDIGFPGIPDKVWLYISILVMMFTAGMFTASTAQEGAMIICIEGWAFLLFGWFDSIDHNGAIMAGLGFATVVAIISLINKFNKREGFE